MREEFLHYLWKYRLFDEPALKDSEGNSITVLNPGEYNRDSGPDFFNARILINDVVWAGNVEIHTKASHFEAHGHQFDRAFDNIILHVVGENDRQVFNSRGEPVPVAEMKFDNSIYDRYIELINNPYVIACQPEVGQIDQTVVAQWLGTLAVERLEEKSVRILNMLRSTENSWEGVTYRLIARYFGFRVNADAFELLAKNLPFKIIQKHADNPFQVEALLLGTAGLLDSELFKETGNDGYRRQLEKEFKILSAKYSITPLHGWLWKFSKLRPANFPTVRIAQLAKLLGVSGGIFSRIKETRSIDQLAPLFKVSASGYWDNHYHFGNSTREFPKIVGKQATNILLINVVIPLLFVYGKQYNDQEISDRAIEFLEKLEPENNLIIREWKEAGIDADSAFRSQALIQLRNNYCKKRRCIECRIGYKLICKGKMFIEQNRLLLEP